MFWIRTDSVLQELGTEHNGQAVQASLAFHLRDMDCRIALVFPDSVLQQVSPVPNKNRG